MSPGPARAGTALSPRADAPLLHTTWGRFLHSHMAKPRYSVTYCRDRQEVVATPSNSDTIKDRVSLLAIEHVPISNSYLAPS